MSNPTATLSDALEILEAISAACDYNEVQDCLEMANAHWSADGMHRDDILDAALLLKEAQDHRIMGNIALALKREASLDRILASYSL